MDERIMMKDVPCEDRPRERLIRDGAQSLSDRDLLAIILRSGSRYESVLELSGRLISEFGGIENLQEASVEELGKIRGIGTAKAVQLLASFEIAKRLVRHRSDQRYTIRSPEDGAQFVMEEMRTLKQEHFVAVFLNTKNQVLHKSTIFIGSLNASIVHPREVFKEAVRRSAASMICFHNHPSGDPSPSREDVDVTKRLVSCGKMLGVDVLDHIVIGDRKYISLKQKGMM
ncbi:DNA repair protein RadC [Sporolactobacillus sp. Y61]|jgi:DNA repair protein RadC|uniref:DNA repair protein RadC n=1 Tax=Sporolactobacillus sp. Y61 TaxID=3160863 RepID=A0AAU8IEJ3_9BACL|nr:DNA repair protein RadC [Sporolactobacillus sp. THM19-2]RYL94681.1 JAB domain-containing protein [Sporolactobacillus sp. THM19-2]